MRVAARRLVAFGVALGGAGICLIACSSDPEAKPKPEARVLVFSKTAGFRHDSIRAGRAAIASRRGASHLGWTLVVAMATRKVQPTVWGLAEDQHGVVARRQLLALGLTEAAIKQRTRRGRLHLIHRGVYAVGRPKLTEKGRWMAAVLACGPAALLSDESAAALYRIRKPRGGVTDITVPPTCRHTRAGIAVHRRIVPSEHIGAVDGIPLTRPVLTLVHLAGRLDRRQLETAMNEADKLGLVDTNRLLWELNRIPRQPGLALVRRILDRHQFVLTDSELERLFLPLARRAGLGLPLTRQRLNGFVVDFFWPNLGLVVETDGLTYHRTAAQQSRDRLRDQRHTAAGLTCLRFTHHQVAREQHHVIATLKSVADRLSQASSGGFGSS